MKKTVITACVRRSSWPCFVMGKSELVYCSLKRKKRWTGEMGRSNWCNVPLPPSSFSLELRILKNSSAAALRLAGRK